MAAAAGEEGGAALSPASPCVGRETPAGSTAPPTAAAEGRRGPARPGAAAVCCRRCAAGGAPPGRPSLGPHRLISAGRPRGLPRPGCGALRGWSATGSGGKQPRFTFPPACVSVRRPVGSPSALWPPQE